MNMGKVSMGLSMSLDGFIAGPNDGPERPLGEGGERIFAWYSGGDTEYRLPVTEMVFRISLQSAELLREAHSKMGAFVTGRRTFDITNGWQPPVGCAHLRRHPYGPTRMGLRGIALHVRHRRRRKRHREGEEGRGGQGRRRGSRQHRPAVHRGRAARRDTHRPCARPARRGRPVVRPSGHRANRTGTHEGDRGPRGNPPDVPRRQVAPKGETVMSDDDIDAQAYGRPPEPNPDLRSLDRLVG